MRGYSVLNLPPLVPIGALAPQVNVLPFKQRPTCCWIAKSLRFEAAWPALHGRWHHADALPRDYRSEGREGFNSVADGYAKRRIPLHAPFK